MAANSAVNRANGAPPSSVTDAVLVKSNEMPEGARKVEELDFNKFAGRPITIDDLMGGMNNMGFQATSIGQAVKIINDMVCILHPAPILLYLPQAASMARRRNWRQNDHFPWLHIKSHLFRSSWYAPLPRPTQTHIRNRHHSRWRRRRLHKMSRRHLHGILLHPRR